MFCRINCTTQSLSSSNPGHPFSLTGKKSHRSSLSMMPVKDDDFILFLLLLSQQLPLTAAVLSNAKLKHFLSYIELKRGDRHIPRCALIHADQSPFQRLYHSKNDQSLFTFTGLDCNSFECLLHKFRPLYYRYSPYSVDGKIVILNNGGA